LGREIPEWQSLERYQDRTQLRRQGAVELLIVVLVLPGKLSAHWHHRERPTWIADVQHPHHSSTADSPEVRGAVNDQGFPVFLKHLFLENGDGGGVAVTVVFASENANPRIGGQPRIDFTDGCEKVLVYRVVRYQAADLAWPHPLKLGFWYVLTSHVAVKRRLFRGGGELHHDGPHFFRKIRMTDQSDSQIGIYPPLVHFPKRDNIELVVHRHQGPDNPVDSGGLVGQTDLRRCTVSRLGTNKRLTGHP